MPPGDSRLSFVSLSGSKVSLSANPTVTKPDEPDNEVA